MPKSGSRASDFDRDQDNWPIKSPEALSVKKVGAVWYILRNRTKNFWSRKTNFKQNMHNDSEQSSMEDDSDQSSMEDTSNSSSQSDDDVFTELLWEYICEEDDEFSLHNKKGERLCCIGDRTSSGISQLDMRGYSVITLPTILCTVLIFSEEGFA